MQYSCNANQDMIDSSIIIITWQKDRQSNSSSHPRSLPAPPSIYWPSQVFCAQVQLSPEIGLHVLGFSLPLDPLWGHLIFSSMILIIIFTVIKSSSPRWHAHANSHWAPPTCPWCSPSGPRQAILPLGSTQAIVPCTEKDLHDLNSELIVDQPEDKSWDRTSQWEGQGWSRWTWIGRRRWTGAGWSWSLSEIHHALSLREEQAKQLTTSLSDSNSL